MRKRWKLQYEIADPLTMYFLWATWAIGWMIVTLVVSVTTHHGKIAGIPAVICAVFWGFGGVVVPVLAGLVFGLRWLWRHPPVRRVHESSPDIREVYRD